MKFLIINGPNINMLGIREPELYGQNTYEDLCKLISNTCEENYIEYELFQSNWEGAIVDKIQDAYGKIDGIIINPAAYTHTSVAILDALKAVDIPAVEVHITEVNEREEFRKVSYVKLVATKTIAGEGFDGYRQAILWLKEKLEKDI